MAVYSWLSQVDAVAALRGRLYNSQLWSDAELWNYIVEALRLFNGLTEQWKSDWVIVNANGAWIDSGNGMTSPRRRTLTSNDLFTQMEYMLLEPASGGTWTGSSQFSIADLQSALQKRLQDTIQDSACNIQQLPLQNSVPGTRRNLLADNVLQPMRIRYIPQRTPVDYGPPITLTREDTFAWSAYEPDWLQTFGPPQSWSVSAEPPLSFDTDFAPNTPGQYDILALISAPTIAAPTGSLLGVPNDWSMVPMYGALSDVLSREPEAVDRQRAQYCFQRYEVELDAMSRSNWLADAFINNNDADTTSLMEMDSYAPNWQDNANTLSSFVIAGTDFGAPTPQAGQSLTMRMIQNAPLLDSTNTYVQVSRDDWNSILDYSHHVALFKRSGEDFFSSISLLQNFYKGASNVNKRLLTYGLFVEAIRNTGRRERIVVPRKPEDINEQMQVATRAMYFGR